MSTSSQQSVPEPSGSSPEAGPPAPGAAATHVREVLAGIGGQIEQLRAIQSDLDHQALAQAERERDLHERQEALAADRAMLIDERADLEASRGQIRRRQQELEAREQALAGQIEEAGVREAALRDEQDSFDAERGAWIEQRREAEAALAEAARASEQREAELAARDEATAVRGQELERAAEAHQVREQELAAQAQAQREAMEALQAEARARQQELEETRQRAAGLQTTVEELAAELEQARDAHRAEAEASAEKARALEAQVRGLETELAEACSRREMGTDLHIRALQQRIGKLEGELREAQKNEPPAAAPEPDPGIEAAQADLREKTRRLAAVAERLQRRRDRLRAVRRGRRGRAGGAAGRREAANKQNQDRTRERGEMQQRFLAFQERCAALAAAEKRMMRRWGGQRAAVGVAAVMVIAAISAAASWVAAGLVAPPVVSASVTLQARSREPGPLAEKQAEEWGRWHEAIVGSSAFRELVASRLKDRRLEPWMNPRRLGDRLDRDLTLDDGEPGLLTLTLAGTDPEGVTALLDVVATTVVAESARQVRHRTGKAWAKLTGRHTDGATVRYSVLNTTPIEDRRLVVSTAIFAVVFLLALALLAAVYRRLMQVSREFNEDGTLFEPLATGA